MNKTAAGSTTTAQAMTVYPILFAISMVHLLNDTMQSAIPALFPILRDSLALSYSQIGWISFAMNMTASVFQPLVGLYSDIRPRPYILPLGVCFTLIGVVMLAFAPEYSLILLAVTSIGLGSSIFHPESSRVAYLAAGERRGLAQSIFQVGGNIGTSLGPLMTALIFIPLGQRSVAWFAFAAVAAIIIQFFVARWYASLGVRPKPRKSAAADKPKRGGLSKGKIGLAISVLILLLFSKNVYSISISSFYAFFMMDHYGVGKSAAQWYVFAFLGAAAVGTFFGGPMADRYGRKNIIWLSILGAAPFSLLLPYANLFWSGVLVVLAGFIMSSSFSIIVVYAQELLPGKVGLVSGLFFGLSFGLGGLGSALLGHFADQWGIMFIMQLSSYLPLIGLLTVLLPKDKALKSG
ncbi:MFS transporter [Paenibacillus sp. DYY-L-2]|uniref:MFS transporter n=1 Tax=Paenibacillus sp. DYY-L-2 TaxID=3447013 RepID=UPI003F50B237